MHSDPKVLNIFLLYTFDLCKEMEASLLYTLLHHQSFLLKVLM